MLGKERLLGGTVGPCRLVAELGSGGMGTVYLGELLRPEYGLEAGARVAVKVVHPRLLETPDVIRRFRREAEIGRSVRHPNVVRTLDVGMERRGEADSHFIVMEFVRGQTLRALLEEEGALPEELCRHLGREVAQAVEAIHAAGVVHRDLKPENILITGDQEVRVMDLGVARLQGEATRLTRTGAFVGSLNYAAPEQLREGGTDLDGRVDLWALGVTLQEAATGQHPFGRGDLGTMIRRILLEEPPPASRVNSRVTPFFEEVLQRLLRKEREERFPSARDLLDVLVEGEQCTWWRCRARAIRRSAHRPPRRVRIERATPLFGRDAESARLADLFQRAKAGRGQVVLVEGEAGIGKTRLVDEFVGRLEEQGEEVHFLFGSYPPIGPAAAGGAFSTAYREHFGAEALEESLRDCLKGGTALVPAFAALLRGDSLPRGGEPLSRDALASLFVRVTGKLASERPVVVLIDDLHFAPEQGRNLFAALALAVPEERVLLVGTARPGLPRDWVAGLDRLGHACRMPLGRLGPKDLSRLLVAALGSERLAEDLGFKVARKSDGNPYFAFEILRGLQEGQFLTRVADGTFVKTRTVGDLQIPSSVMDLIQARIADLEEMDRDILDVASCCGYEFDPLLVGEVLGMAPIPLLKRLGRLEGEHRLVRSVGVRCAFDHHQVQEALNGGLPELLRREYHAALGEALERREKAAERDPEELDGAVAAAVADHLLRGGRPERALRYLGRALDYLEESYLNDAAVELADRAQAVPGLLRGEGRLTVLIRKAGRLELLGRWEEERRTLDEALAEADAAGRPAMQARVRRGIGRHLSLRGRFEEALAVLEEALAFARSAGDRREEAACLRGLGVVSWHLGRYSEAQAFHETTLALGEEGGSVEADASTTGNLGQIYQVLRRSEEAREYAERQLALSRGAKDLRGEAAALGNLGGIWYERRDYPRARGLFEEAREMSLRIGDRRGEARAAGNLGRVLRDLGRYGEALELLDGSAATARDIGYRRGEARALGHLGRIARELGRAAEARDRSGRYRDLAREMGIRGEEAHALRDLGVLAAQEGLHDDAARCFEESLSLWGETVHLAGRASTLLAWARSLAATGQAEEAVRRLEEARVLAGEADAADEIVLSEALRAGLPGGDPATGWRTRTASSWRSGTTPRPRRGRGSCGTWSSTGPSRRSGGKWRRTPPPRRDPWRPPRGIDRRQAAD